MHRAKLLLPFGIILVVVGFCSNCIGGFYYSVEQEKKTKPMQVAHLPDNFCADSHPLMIIGKGTYSLVKLQADCWTKKIEPLGDSRALRTVPLSNEKYIVVCANLYQFQGSGVVIWAKERGCEPPAMFKAVDKSFEMTVYAE